MLINAEDAGHACVTYFADNGHKHARVGRGGGNSGWLACVLEIAVKPHIVFRIMLAVFENTTAIAVLGMCRREA